ncbi:hypothetical protein K435DRAFT_783842 [Dendrothele bispora CBS 962.96]|uniref:DNA-directed RNA polymerase III subunit RPC9 n=1 Tax=Dendrothele bispora (strain CBS 962.96) TaxID=1314807 RepID=A0A4S8L810_DENBC|nr:hypothetical protein K435DRAFT_783842 [Dendrothele bispora CBS 962.96]
MEVVNPRSALLSNYEVLSLLRELESDHINRTRVALRIKKEEESAGGSSTIIPGVKHPSMAIQYLSAPHQPTSMQTPEGITKITKALARYDLTKAEKLQIINLAPTQPVELYVIIEELEDRLGHSMDDILELVKSSLSDPVPQSHPPQSHTDTQNQAFEFDSLKANGIEPHDSFGDVDADGDVDMDDEHQFDDTGEGAGIEGDLDVEDD